MAIADFFANPVGITALLALIPFIILYLIRPKAKDLTIPSVMFLIKKGGRQEKSSFLKNFLRDFLFLLQLLLLLFLALSVADPFIKISGRTSADTVVIVLDISASMGAQGVWDNAITEAKDHLGRKNSMVLVGDHSLVALEGGSSGEAEAILGLVRPSISGSNIADGLATARTLIEEGEIVLISDLKQTASGDLLAAKVAAEAEGLSVVVVDVGKDLDNLAIVDVQVTAATSKIYVKNYYAATKTVPLLIHDTEQSLTIPGNGLEIVTIATPEGITKIELDVDDALALDNVAYIATPTKQKNKVLFVTERDDDSFMRVALLSSPLVDLELVHPPIIPDKEFDFIVFQDIDTSKLLAGTMD